MSLLDALAAALRDRLLANGTAAVPGHGTLQRQRAAARVEEQSDGSRLLLPPSETVVFTPGRGDADAALATALGRQLNRADGAAALQEATDQLDGLLSATGTSVLPGVGTLRRTGAGIAFDIDPALLAAVGQPYDGLAPVSTASASSTAPPPADEVFIDEDTLDDDLDDVLDDNVLAVPFDASGTLGLTAILPTTDPERDPSVASPTAVDDAASQVNDVASSSPPVGGRSPIPPTHSERPTEATASLPAEPPSPTPDSVTADDLATDASDELAAEGSDLEWLNEYEDADTAEAVVATAAVPAAPPEPELARVATPTPGPTPTPDPVHEASSRSGVWLWALVPLIVLVAAFFWFRSTQTTEMAEPVQTAEPSARLASEPPPADSLIADATPPAVDSLAAGTAATADSLASSTAANATDLQVDRATTAPDSAALAGEFPVREMSGASRRAVPAAPPASASSAPRATRTAPARRSPIDPPPNLSELSEADREALVGTAPIVIGRGGFAWVLLSTREREPADRRAKLFRDAGWRVRVLQTEALGDTVFRVALGQFDSREQADRLRPLLPSQVPADTWRLDLSTL